MKSVIHNLNWLKEEQHPLSTKIYISSWKLGREKKTHNHTPKNHTSEKSITPLHNLASNVVFIFVVVETITDSL